MIVELLSLLWGSGVGRARSLRYNPVFSLIFLRRDGDGLGKGRRLVAIERSVEASTVPPATSSHAPVMSSDEEDAMARQRLLEDLSEPRIDRAKLRLLSLVDIPFRGLSESSADRRDIFALTIPPLTCVLLEFGLRIASMFLRLEDNVLGLGSFSERNFVCEGVLTGSFFLANFIFRLMMSCPERWARMGGVLLRSESVLAPT